VQRDSDEDAWQAIVENYGERVELDDGTATEPATSPPSATDTAALDHGLDDDLDEALDDGLDDEPAEAGTDAGTDAEAERFVPPPPPPLPRLPPDRFLAWSGLFGSPTLLLVCLVFGVHLPPWLGYLLVAAFIGGFVYLVVQMPRDPADPWDDGARL
jgi:hypothetical protein